MGAGTPENGNWPRVAPRDLRSQNTSMNANALVAIERDDTAEESSIARAIDLSAVQCVEAHGGDVVFAAIVERTDDGAALARTGEDIPVLTTSVYSRHELRDALGEAGYAEEHIESALSLTLEGERGRRAAHLAESRTRDHLAQIERDNDSDASGEEADTAIATDGGTRTRLDAADFEREQHREEPIGAPSRCDRCGERDPLGRDLVEADWCAEHERVCSECLVDHGPLACGHETPSESKWADMEGI